MPGSWRPHRPPAWTPLSWRTVRRSEAGPRRLRANRHSGNDAGGHVSDRGLGPRISRSVAVATPPLAVNAPHRRPKERNDIPGRTRRPPYIYTLHFNKVSSIPEHGDAA